MSSSQHVSHRGVQEQDVNSIGASLGTRGFEAVPQTVEATGPLAELFASQSTPMRDVPLEPAEQHPVPGSPITHAPTSDVAKSDVASKSEVEQPAAKTKSKARLSRSMSASAASRHGSVSEGLDGSSLTEGRASPTRRRQDRTLPEPSVPATPHAGASTERSKRTLPPSSTGSMTAQVIDPLSASPEVDLLKQRLDHLEKLIEDRDQEFKNAILVDVESMITDKCKAVDAQAQSMVEIMSAMTERVATLEDRQRKMSECQTDMMVKLADLAESITKVEKASRPERHDISSPLPVYSPLGMTATGSPPMFEPAFPNQAFPQCNAMAMSSMRPQAPLLQQNLLSQQQVPTPCQTQLPMPNFRQSSVKQSNFVNASTQPQQQACHAQSGPNVPNQIFSPFGVGKSLQKEISYVIPHKCGPELYKFNGEIKDFKHWKETMIDHFARGTQRYRTLIENVGKRQTRIYKDELIRTEFDGFSAWEISVEVESFTSRFLGKDLYDDRLLLCSGEEQNGLELWRNLFHQYSGTDLTIVKTHGLTNFMNFPQCPDE